MTKPKLVSTWAEPSDSRGSATPGIAKVLGASLGLDVPGCLVVHISWGMLLEMSIFFQIYPQRTEKKSE